LNLDDLQSTNNTEVLNRKWEYEFGLTDVSLQGSLWTLEQGNLLEITRRTSKENIYESTAVEPAILLLWICCVTSSFSLCEALPF
jgi:hypothetical protein